MLRCFALLLVALLGEPGARYASARSVCACASHLGRQAGRHQGRKAPRTAGGQAGRQVQRGQRIGRAPLTFPLSATPTPRCSIQPHCYISPRTHYTRFHHRHTSHTTPGRSLLLIVHAQNYSSPAPALSRCASHTHAKSINDGCLCRRRPLPARRSPIAARSLQPRTSLVGALLCCCHCGQD